MGIKERYKKKIISLLLIVALTFSAIWAYRQWKLLQNFIEKKSGYMLKRYQQKNRCLRDLDYEAEYMRKNNSQKPKSVKAKGRGGDND